AEMAVRQKGAADTVGQPLQEAMAQQGLAGAGRAGQQEQPFAVGQAADQASERAFVTRRRVIAGAVRRCRERPLSRAKVLGIHAGAFPRWAVRRLHGLIREIGSSPGELEPAARNGTEKSVPGLFPHAWNKGRTGVNVGTTDYYGPQSRES